MPSGAGQKSSNQKALNEPAFKILVAQMFEQEQRQYPKTKHVCIINAEEPGERVVCYQVRRDGSYIRLDVNIQCLRGNLVHRAYRPGGHIHDPSYHINRYVKAILGKKKAPPHNSIERIPDTYIQNNIAAMFLSKGYYAPTDHVAIPLDEGILTVNQEGGYEYTALLPAEMRKRKFNRSEGDESDSEGAPVSPPVRHSRRLSMSGKHAALTTLKTSADLCPESLLLIGTLTAENVSELFEEDGETQKHLHASHFAQKLKDKRLLKAFKTCAECSDLWVKTEHNRKWYRTLRLKNAQGEPFGIRIDPGFSRIYIPAALDEELTRPPFPRESTYTTMQEWVTLHFSI